MQSQDQSHESKSGPLNTGFFHAVLSSSTFQTDRSQHPAAPEVAEPQGRALETPRLSLGSHSRASGAQDRPPLIIWHQFEKEGQSQ